MKVNDETLVFIFIGISLIGFLITIFGALYNGFAIFTGSNDLDKGFGLILIGDSTSLLSAFIIITMFVIQFIKYYKEIDIIRK